MARIYKFARLRGSSSKPRSGRLTTYDYVPSPREYLRYRDLTSDPDLSALGCQEIICEIFTNRRGFQPHNPGERRGFRAASEETETKLPQSESDGVKDSGEYTDDDEQGMKFGGRVLKAETLVALERKRRAGTWKGRMRYRDEGQKEMIRKMKAAASQPAQGGAVQPVSAGAAAHQPSNVAGNALGGQVAVPSPEAALLHSLSGLTSASRRPAVPSAPARSVGNLSAHAVQRALYPTAVYPREPYPDATGPRPTPFAEPRGNMQSGFIPRRQFHMAQPPQPAERSDFNAMARADTTMEYTKAQPKIVAPSDPRTYRSVWSAPTVQGAAGAQHSGTRHRELVPRFPAQRYERL